MLHGPLSLIVFQLQTVAWLSTEEIIYLFKVYFVTVLKAQKGSVSLDGNVQHMLAGLHDHPF